MRNKHTCKMSAICDDQRVTTSVVCLRSYDCPREDVTLTPAGVGLWLVALQRLWEENPTHESVFLWAWMKDIIEGVTR